MKIELREILNLDSFKGASVVAGFDGLNRLINNISVMEVPDIDDYIEKDDLLLTTLYPIYKNEALMSTIIPRFFQKDLCAIGLKLNRYIDKIPEIMVKQANEMGFPILLLPQNSNFSIQINEFLNYKIDVRTRAVKHRDYIHNVLMDLMVKGHDFKQLAKNLSQMLKKNVVFMDADFDVIEHTLFDEEYSLDIDLLMQKRDGILNVSRDENFIEESFGSILSCIYIVKYSYRKIGYIMVYSQEKFELNELDSIIIEQHAIVFTIIVQKNKAVNEVEKRYIDEFVFDLISGKIDDDATITNRSKSLSFSLEKPMTMALISVGNLDGRFNDKYEVMDYIKNKVSDLYGSGFELKDNILFAGYENYIVVLLNRKAAKNSSKICEGIIDALLKSAIGEYQMGVSADADEDTDISNSFKQAKLALEIKRSMKGNGLLYFKDIGIFKVLHSVGDRQEMADFCNDTIGKLIDYDKMYNSELLETLRMVIEADGNLKKAAKQMFLHYNTLRYRFKKIEDLLGRELTGIIAYQDIYLAVKIYDIYIKNRK